MAMFYGLEFATRFGQEAKRRRHPDADVLITNRPDYTPQRLSRQGYRQLPMESLTAVDMWVHPSGNEVWLLPPHGSGASQQPLEEDPGVAEARGYAEDLTAARDNLLRKLAALKNAAGRPEYGALFQQFWDEFNTWQQDLNLIREEAMRSLRDEVVEPRDQGRLEEQARRLDALDEWKRTEFPGLVDGLTPP